MEPTSLRFAHTARSLAAVAESLGLQPPTFRSPPRVAGVTRTLRRSSQEAIVSVVLRGRPWAAVAADMVDGVVAANRLGGVAADRARSALWSAVPDLRDEAA
jgi:hypothetical protein